MKNKFKFCKYLRDENFSTLFTNIFFFNKKIFCLCHTRKDEYFTSLCLMHPE